MTKHERPKATPAVYLFLIKEGQVLLLLRKNTGYNDGQYSAIAGHIEKHEGVIEALKKEAFEEAGIDFACEFIKLDTVSFIPKDIFRDHRDKKGFWVIPEYCFAVELKDKSIRLSSEHKAVKWVSYNKAIELLRYDGNKTALWELRQRLGQYISSFLDK